MDVCCCGLLDLTAPWMVVGGAGSADEVPTKEDEHPTEEVLVVETAPVAAGPLSSISVLTCFNSIVGCELFKCLLKFEVLPPLVEKKFLQMLHFATVAKVAKKWVQTSLLSRAQHCPDLSQSLLCSPPCAKQQGMG